MYDKGYTLCEIADYLSNKKIPIPLIYIYSIYIIQHILYLRQVR